MLGKAGVLDRGRIVGVVVGSSVHACVEDRRTRTVIVSSRTARIMNMVRLLWQEESLVDETTNHD